MISDKDKQLLIDFGENLKRIREANGHTLRSLSAECEIDYSDISKIEKGQRNITLTTLFDLAQALDVKPDTLLKF
jgi:transcriptional regulator with XRE-family HTH domain